MEEKDAPAERVEGLQDAETGKKNTQVTRGRKQRKPKTLLFGKMAMGQSRMRVSKNGPSSTNEIISNLRLVSGWKLT